MVLELEKKKKKDLYVVITSKCVKLNMEKE